MSGVSVTGEPTAKMESELLGYKKKVEHMTVLLKHYQNELESQKVRRDGVETVSRLLAECRQENLVLKRNQIAMETLVKNLQNRLTVNGLSSSSATEDNEVIVPGTSKQTLTNLALENKRLRSMLQKDGSSESIDSLQRPVEVKDCCFFVFVLSFSICDSVNVYVCVCVCVYVCVCVCVTW